MSLQAPPPRRTLRLSPRTALALGLGATALLLTASALARPGGGQSFGGGSSGKSGGGSSGGGGGGELILDLILLVIRYPKIGIPVVIVIIIVVLVIKAKEGLTQPSWSSGGQQMNDDARRRAIVQGMGPGAGGSPQGGSHREGARARLEQLRTTDPDFSLVLFEDFLYALYAEVHTARGRGTLDRLSPWLSQPVRARLAVESPNEVTSIVVGSMRFTSSERRGSVRMGGPDQARVTVDFEANYTETRNGKAQSYYVAERWQLARSVSAHSRPPDKTRVFCCPSCGAPLDAIRGNTCSYCKQIIDSGDFDWVVTDASVLTRETRGPMLTGTTVEQGTNDPTIIAPDAQGRYAALATRDPALTWPALMARIQLIFSQFQIAWSSQNLTTVRPFLSDALFQTQLYWVDAYQKAHLRNVTEGAQVVTVHLARVVTDRFYDAITVRVFARGLDFTLDASGKVVSGSRTQPRDYSEYWTLIRGSARTGAPRTDPVCPNCGAPLDIAMTGHCKYCKAKVTSGEFDWVLSRIEQDEVYGG